MKISEAKSGEVRYAESKAASGENRILKRSRDKPDFWEYLSEKDRRRWIRLPDYKKERLLRKARRNAAVRGYLLKADSTGTDGGNPGAERGNTKNKRSAGTASGDRKTIKNPPRRNQGSTDSNVSAGTSFRTTFRGKPGLPASGQEAEGKKKGGFKKGLAGLAASAARKTASKISGAFKDKPDQMSGAEGGRTAADTESAGEEIKTVTGPVKRIVGGMFSLLSLIIGPFFLVIFLVIILVVVVIFLVAWLISVVVPATTGAGGLSPMTGWGGMPYYCQQDDEWGSYPYDAGTLYTYGCGPTSMAMILACLTGDYSITPITMADYGNQDIAAYGMSVGGTHSAATNIAALYGIGGIEQMAGPYQNCCGLRTAYDLPYIKKKIAEGSPILVSVTGSYCNVRTEGHYFVLYGQGENGVYIYDPATLGRVYQESMDSRGTDWELCLNSAKHIWIFPAPESRITGDSNAEKIFRYLVKAGWSKASAAAAVGNFYQEAGGGGSTDINPASYSNARGAEGGGIAGFTDNGEADSFMALRHYAEQRGKKWTDLQIQCDFLIDQMSHGTWWGAYNTPTFVQMQEHGYSVRHVTYEEFIRMTDVSEATKAFLCFYEDCGYRDAHYEDVRLPMARQAYATWGS